MGSITAYAASLFTIDVVTSSFVRCFSVPSLPPMNVSTAPLNATFFSITWEPVPPGHNHGIILGYKVLLENMEDTSLVLTAIVNVNQTWIMLKECSKSALILCARVVAFTSKGDGQSSTCNEVWTWSEGKLFYGL